MRSLDQITLAPNERAAIAATGRILRERFPVEQIVLFGSKARGTDDPESDIDLLVLTSRELTWKERAALINALYRVQLAQDVLLSPLVVSRSEWEAGIFSVLPLHREIDRDGIPA